MAAHEKVVTTKMDEELLSQLDEAAARLDRSRSWVVREAVAEWLDEEELRHRLTLEGLADVDAGRLLDQADVEAHFAERRRKRGKDGA